VIRDLALRKGLLDCARLKYTGDRLLAFTPYIHFNGNARAAMTFYADVFGAADLSIQSYSDAPPEVGLPATDAVMHAQFSLDGHLLMAADAMPGRPYTPQAAVSVSHAVTSVDAGQVIFDKLADRGDIVMPFARSFFAAGFGMCKDKFGTHWMINVADA